MITGLLFAPIVADGTLEQCGIVAVDSYVYRDVMDYVEKSEFTYTTYTLTQDVDITSCILLVKISETQYIGGCITQDKDNILYVDHISNSLMLDSVRIPESHMYPRNGIIMGLNNILSSPISRVQGMNIGVDSPLDVNTRLVSWVAVAADDWGNLPAAWIDGSEVSAVRAGITYIDVIMDKRVILETMRRRGLFFGISINGYVDGKISCIERHYDSSDDTYIMIDGQNCDIIYDIIDNTQDIVGRVVHNRYNATNASISLIDCYIDPDDVVHYGQYTLNAPPEIADVNVPLKYPSGIKVTYSDATSDTADIYSQATLSGLLSKKSQNIVHKVNIMDKSHNIMVGLPVKLIDNKRKIWYKQVRKITRYSGSDMVEVELYG